MIRARRLDRRLACDVASSAAAASSASFAASSSASACSRSAAFAAARARRSWASARRLDTMTIWVGGSMRMSMSGSSTSGTSKSMPSDTRHDRWTGGAT